MNFEAKTELTKALTSDEQLKSLVTGGFHNRYSNDVTKYPRVIITEIQNKDEGFYDNKAQGSALRFQLSIFCNTQTVSNETKIAKQIDNVMKNLEYTCYDSQDLFEEDNEIYHKAMRYRKSIFN
ncbi:hypothetical protein P8860_21720 [Bacillus spizizenii]|uniref:DUF3168 domain-containing protein n=1 Tax=Bacillus spizizenii TaxID=96241 RepID=A0A9Q4DWP0_BACSC|nr:hypothetical protein [Bacillus spizizenii]MEC0581913.1 hypothetical protein [Bacillus spizizenii]MEC0631876.1 hypothetical protein [Bacillus spizizenii]